MTRALSLLPYALAARIGRWLRGRKLARMAPIAAAGDRRRQKLLAVHIAAATPHRTIGGSLV